MSILITGGCGYIGSHTVKYLQENGEDIIIVDNLKTGHLESVNTKNFYNIDIRDKENLNKIFKNHNIDAVIHFSASSLVGESMENPSLYFNNNVYGMISLLDCMKDNNVKKIIFSSSAATYGNPTTDILSESSPTKPTNPYGETKLIMEKIMKWYDYSYNIKYVSLRYFNAAGAYKDSSIGEVHNPETHLIPIILSVPLGQREKVYVFGDDYDTKDGTCIRDYVHVIDLADAHYKAYKYLKNDNKSEIFNLGTGIGYSVLEVIQEAEKVVKQKIKYEISERRQGDPKILVASNKKAKDLLNWEIKHSSLSEILTDAWNFHKKFPYGYKKTDL